MIPGGMTTTRVMLCRSLLFASKTGKVSSSSAIRYSDKQKVVLFRSFTDNSTIKNSAIENKKVVNIPIELISDTL